MKRAALSILFVMCFLIPAIAVHSAETSVNPIGEAAEAAGTIAAVAAEHAEGAVPEGYLFSTTDGALKELRDKESGERVTAYLLDTYEALTINKETVVGWGTSAKAAEKSLTDLGKDLRGRLLKENDIADVFVSNRAIVIRFFPLPRGNVLDQIKNALGAE